MENKLLENILQEEKEGFKITDLSSAAWAMKKLKAIETKEEELKAIAEEEINNIDNC